MEKFESTTKNEESKAKDMIEKIKIINSQYQCQSNNNLKNINNDTLLKINSYINLIKEISIKINIPQIKSFLDSLKNINTSLINLPQLYEEGKNYYINYESFKTSISDKLNDLERIKNEIIKYKSKIFNLKKNLKQNEELKLSMNLNEINSIEDCTSNPILCTNVDNKLINQIKETNLSYNKYIKNYFKYSPLLKEIKIINDEFQNNIMKCNFICKDMKDKYLCNKFMKNTGENLIKIHNNVYNCYLNIFNEYFFKLSKIINKQIEQYIKNNEIKKEEDNININVKEDNNKDINNENENTDNDKNLDALISDGLKYIIGKKEYYKNNMIDNEMKILNLDAEFNLNESLNNNINNNNNDGMNKEIDLRQKNYQELFDITSKFCESNKNNDDIILELTNLEKNFNIKKEEIVHEKNLLNEKYNKMIKYKREDLDKEKKILEIELNNLKLKEKEYELKYTDLISKNKIYISYDNKIQKLKEDKKKEIKDKEKKKEKLKILINNEDIKKEEVKNDNNALEKNDDRKKEHPINNKEIINKKEKEKDNEKEKNEIKNNNNNIQKRQKITKNLIYLNKDLPFKKEALEPIDNKNNINDNNNNNNKSDEIKINKEDNNPFKLEQYKEKENEKENGDSNLIKQVRALDNLSSALSNRNKSKNKKEITSPTIIKRGIQNENNITRIFSGLNINDNNNFISNGINNNLNKNIDKNNISQNNNININSNNKTNNNVIKPEINIFNSDFRPTNIFNQFQNNNSSNNLMNNNNNLTNKTNLFDFNENSNNNNPFNINYNKEQNPFTNKTNLNNNNDNNKSPFIFNTKTDFINFTQKNKKEENIFNKIPFGMHTSTIGGNGNKLNINNINNSNNLINMSFGNNNNINGNNSQSPFIFFNNNKDLNNFGNKTQDNNDENYF